MSENKKDDQSERFLETARELGVDLDEDQLRRTLGKLAKVKEAEPEAPTPKAPTPKKPSE